jgi:hypothetical protein
MRAALREGHIKAQTTLTTNSASSSPATFAFAQEASALRGKSPELFDGRIQRPWQAQLRYKYP